MLNRFVIVERAAFPGEVFSEIVQLDPAAPGAHWVCRAAVAGDMLGITWDAPDGATGVIPMEYLPLADVHLRRVSGPGVPAIDGGTCKCSEAFGIIRAESAHYEGELAPGVIQRGKAWAARSDLPNGSEVVGVTRFKRLALQSEIF